MKNYNQDVSPPQAIQVKMASQIILILLNGPPSCRRLFEMKLGMCLAANAGHFFLQHTN